MNTPPLDLLNAADTEPLDDGARIENLTETIDSTLAAFGVDGKVTGHTVGAAITRFEVELAAGTGVDKITKLDRDLALATASRSVRVLAPIPGRSVVGIEVPNEVRATVPLASVMPQVLAAPRETRLPIPVGQDVDGAPVVADLTRLPHLLVAGTTNSGKSVFINDLITGLAMVRTPSQMQLVLIDPKKVELAPYQDLPHVRGKVVTDPMKAATRLSRLADEMDKRYETMAEHGVKNIAEMRSKSYELADTSLLMPYVVVVIDELADLMMTASRRVEEAIVRIAQKGRAAGFHLVLATQRPVVKVVTGLIKANVPSRMTFSVSSVADSMVALDRSGAQALTGQGDGLWLPVGAPDVTRVQAPLVTTDEIEKVVAWWSENYAAPRLAVVKEAGPKITEEMKSQLATGGPIADLPSKDRLTLITGQIADAARESQARAAVAGLAMAAKPVRSTPPSATPTYEETLAKHRELVGQIRAEERNAAERSKTDAARRAALELEKRTAAAREDAARQAAEQARERRLATIPATQPIPVAAPAKPMTRAATVWSIIGIVVGVLVFGYLLLPITPILAAVFAAVWFVQSRPKASPFGPVRTGLVGPKR